MAALEVKVLSFARAHEGEVLEYKERCSELADLALVSSGARTFTDFGTGASENTYVWGTSVDPKDARPGDVIQFEDVAISQTTATFLSHYRERFTADPTDRRRRRERPRGDGRLRAEHRRRSCGSADPRVRGVRHLRPRRGRSAGHQGGHDGEGERDDPRLSTAAAMIFIRPRHPVA